MLAACLSQLEARLAEYCSAVGTPRGVLGGKESLAPHKLEESHRRGQGCQLEALQPPGGLGDRVLLGVRGGLGAHVHTGSWDCALALGS